MRGEALTPPSAGDRRLSGARKRAGKTVEEYTGLPYHLMVVRDGEDKGKPWSASVEELPGCTSQGSTSRRGAWRHPVRDGEMDRGRAGGGARDSRAEVCNEPQRAPAPANAPDAPRGPDASLRARGSEPEPVHHRRPRRRRRVAIRPAGLHAGYHDNCDQSGARRRGAHRGARRTPTHEAEPDAGYEHGPGGELRHRRPRRDRRDHRPDRRAPVVRDRHAGDGRAP